MFNKIMVALDGSEHAAQAMEMGIGLASRCDAGLILFHAVHVHPFRSDYDLMVVRSAREVFERIGREQADAILAEAEHVARQAGVSSISRVVGEGDPVKAMLKILADVPVDLVVVGTRGLSGLQEIALGSVAHKMSVAAPCPVLIVK
ncbi:MAG: universal stress protein [Gammaproteobacteria bacterium]|nr:universal stress protein [Gammaproteobacteria bacterium]